MSSSTRDRVRAHLLHALRSPAVVVYESRVCVKFVFQLAVAHSKYALAHAMRNIENEACFGQLTHTVSMSFYHFNVVSLLNPYNSLELN